jgi:predicted CXXCH cytochrome family protein
VTSFRVALLALLVGAAGLGGWWLAGESAVIQPVAFPHKAHLDLQDPKFECTTCHDRATKGPVAGRPSTKKCVSCHSGEAKSAEEKKLQALADRGGEIPWRRIWRLPAHVLFSHRTHVVVAKVKCQTCHGPMETLERPPARALKQLTMNDCIGCHAAWRWPDEGVARGAEPGRALRAQRVSTDCNACHR